MKTLPAIAALLLLVAASSSARAVPCGEERDDVAEMVELCRDVSPATHPPCNAQNECALIESEISRGCGMLAPKDRPEQCKGY